jgi:hypothetical protein
MPKIKTEREYLQYLKEAKKIKTQMRVMPCNRSYDSTQFKIQKKE